jgi:hypothetical protein
MEKEDVGFGLFRVFLQALGEWRPMVLLYCCDVKEERGREGKLDEAAALL